MTLITLNMLIENIEIGQLKKLKWGIIRRFELPVGLHEGRHGGVLAVHLS